MASVVFNVMKRNQPVMTAPVQIEPCVGMKLVLETTLVFANQDIPEILVKYLLIHVKQIPASMEQNARVSNKEDLTVSVHLDGKVLYVIKTLMIVLRSHACLELIALIWSMTSHVTAPMALLESDVKPNQTSAETLNVSMENVLINSSDMSKFIGAAFSVVCINMLFPER